MTPTIAALVGAGAIARGDVARRARLRPLVPTGTRILPAVVHCGAELQGRGKILHRTNGYMVVPRDADGSGPADGPRLHLGRAGTR